MANVPQNLCPIIIVVEVAIPYHPLLVVSATVEECFLLIHLNGNIAVSINIKIHFCVQFQMGENCLMMSLYLYLCGRIIHPPLIHHHHYHRNVEESASKAAAGLELIFMKITIVT